MIPALLPRMTRSPFSFGSAWLVPSLIVFAILTQAMSARPQSTRIERVFPYEQADIKHALVEMHAAIESTLQSLDGVVEESPEQLKKFQQPRYRFVVEVTRLGAEKSRVQVAARISAWYGDADLSRAGNRALRSNGRLENDLLDRLEERLRKTVWTLPGGSGPPPPLGNDPSAKTPTLEQQIARLRPRPLAEMSSEGGADPDAVTPATLEADLAALRAQRETAEQQNQQLKQEIDGLENPSPGAAAHAPGFVILRAPSVPVRERPDEKARILFEASEQDQFEAQETRGAWTRVALSREGGGWIKSNQLAAGSIKTSGENSGEARTDKGSENNNPAALSSPAKPIFSIIREDTFPYSGEWKALQGKQAVFVVTRPATRIPSGALGSAQLAFAKQMFAEHYRQAAHLPHVYSGVVVIFFGSKGGVAASTLPLIRQWMEGTLSATEFLKRSSLDPPEAFLDQRKE